MEWHVDPDVVAAVAGRRDLEGHFLEADAVISVDCPLEVFTENVIDIFPYPGNEGGSFFDGRFFKLGVEGKPPPVFVDSV